MRKCPLTREGCTVDCAWFRNGECCIVPIADALEVLSECVDIHDNYGAVYHSFNVTTGD